MEFNQRQGENLSQLLAGEIAGARDLLHTLEQEYQALTLADADTIESASARKQQQMQRLQQLLLERDRFLQQQSLAPGKEGMEQLLEQHPVSEATLSLWEELQDLASRLKEQNEVNGGIVALGQRHVRQALDLLTGRSNGDHTYGPAGGHRSGHTPQTLAKA